MTLKILWRCGLAHVIHPCLVLLLRHIVLLHRQGFQTLHTETWTAKENIKETQIKNSGLNNKEARMYQSANDAHVHVKWGQLSEIKWIFQQKMLSPGQQTPAFIKGDSWPCFDSSQVTLNYLLQNRQQMLISENHYFVAASLIRAKTQLSIIKLTFEIS